MYNGEHSIRFYTDEEKIGLAYGRADLDGDGKVDPWPEDCPDTWENWRLIPDGKPLFATPAEDTHFIKVPGMHGQIDANRYIYDKPVYGMRTGTIRFYMDPYRDKNPATVHSELTEYFYEREHFAVLKDDPHYYYRGSFSVGKITPEGDWDTIELSYSLYPFKFERWDGTQPWIWDEFNFKTGIARAYTATLNKEESVTFAVPTDKRHEPSNMDTSIRVQWCKDSFTLTAADHERYADSSDDTPITGDAPEGYYLPETSYVFDNIIENNRVKVVGSSASTAYFWMDLSVFVAESINNAYNDVKAEVEDGASANNRFIFITDDCYKYTASDSYINFFRFFRGREYQLDTDTDNSDGRIPVIDDDGSTCWADGEALVLRVGKNLTLCSGIPYYKNEKDVESEGWLPPGDYEIDKSVTDAYGHRFRISTEKWVDVSDFGSVIADVYEKNRTSPVLLLNETETYKIEISTTGSSSTAELVNENVSGFFYLMRKIPTWWLLTDGSRIELSFISDNSSDVDADDPGSPAGLIRYIKTEDVPKFQVSVLPEAGYTFTPSNTNAVESRTIEPPDDTLIVIFTSHSHIPVDVRVNYRRWKL